MLRIPRCILNLLHPFRISISPAEHPASPENTLPPPADSEPITRKPVQSAPSLATETEVTTEEGIAALQRILDSPLFEHSLRLRRLLDHIGQYSLKNQLDCLKERVIAVEVFGMAPATFDGKIDNVVRVNVAKVRNKLAEYYMYHPAGQEDEIVVSIPKGRYVATFARRNRGGEEGGDRGPGAPLDKTPSGSTVAPSSRAGRFTVLSF
jgi:hypothetical protein